MEQDQDQDQPQGQSPQADPYATQQQTQAADPEAEDQRVTENAGTVGDFGLGTRVYGYIGTLAHVVTDGRTTACGKLIDATSPVERLARTPGGAVCGTCLGVLVGA